MNLRKRRGTPGETAPRTLPQAKTPQRQPKRPSVPGTARTDRKRRSAYGTAQPPWGLSGWLRNFAHKYPSHQKRHWMMLMLADQVA